MRSQCDQSLRNHVEVFVYFERKRTGRALSARPMLEPHDYNARRIVEQNKMKTEGRNEVFVAVGPGNPRIST